MPILLIIMTLERRGALDRRAKAPLAGCRVTSLGVRSARRLWAQFANRSAL